MLTYDESYKIAADSDFLFRYLYEADLKVEYLNEYIVRMRMGGLSTDSAKRKQMWQEDVRMYRSHGLPPYLDETTEKWPGRYHNSLQQKIKF